MRKFQIIRILFTRTNLLITLPLQLSLFLFPLSLLISPMIPMIWVHAYSIVILSFWIFTFSSSFVLRRAHCGYTCGITSVFILLNQIKRYKKGETDIKGASSSLAYEMPQIANIIIKTVYFTLPFILMIYYIRGLMSPLSIPLVIVTLLYPLGAVLSFSLGKSNSQHYLCPLSPFLNTGTRPVKLFIQLDIKSEVRNCIECGNCSSACLLGNQISQQLTAGDFEKRECMNCGECAAVCPNGVLEYKFFHKF